MANKKWTNNSHLVLETASNLKNYNRWLISRFEGHMGKNIIEIGSGIGALSSLLPKTANITLSDLRDDYFSYLKDKYKYQVIKLDITKPLDPSLVGNYDTLLSSNVFEHIEDDLSAFRNSYKLLKPGGKLLLIVPARPEIYGQLDDDMGHFRRYLISEVVEKSQSAGFVVIKAQYANIPGYFAWWGRGLLLGKIIKSRSGDSFIDSLLAKIFDVFITPLLSIEKFIHPPFGQNLILIAKKPNTRKTGYI